MHQLIDKKNKTLIYLTFLLILSTVSSKISSKILIYSIKINVTGLSNSKNLQLVNKLNDLFYKNIFFINKDEIKKIISVNNIIEEYNVKVLFTALNMHRYKTNKVYCQNFS